MTSDDDDFIKKKLKTFQVSEHFEYLKLQKKIETKMKKLFIKKNLRIFHFY